MQHKRTVIQVAHQLPSEHDTQYNEKQKEKVARRFYALFQHEYRALRSQVTGGASPEEEERFTIRLTLRLLFLAFLQHNGWLQPDLTAGHTPAHVECLLARLSPGLLEPQSLRRHPHVPDVAIERLFAFLSCYQWKLYEQVQGSEQVLTPEIIGYIFEKTSRQKHTGTYYTGADITHYISSNTIVPYLLEQLQRQYPATLHEIRRLLRCQPNRYIQPAVQYEDLLPTETPDEFERRRSRYQALLHMLETEAITEIHQGITHRLNLQRLAQDVIATTHDITCVHICYAILRSMTILDPTCGSGAFLLAALHILQPLYRCCLHRLMEQPEDISLPEPDTIEVFILKEILQNNLYGVDLMPEAVEICKQRLFLCLLAAYPHPSEPGPLQWHIRTGNALVGYLHASRTDTAVLDHALARAYGLATDNPQDFEHWKETHSPFHWAAEFPTVMQRGGFDVLIGNPPYVEYSQIRERYSLLEGAGEQCGNLYAAVLERALQLSRQQVSYLGFLVPLSICGSQRFQRLRTLIRQQTARHWFANFEIFPCRLFQEAYQRLSFFLAQHGSAASPQTYVTKILRWYAAERPHLLDLLHYTAVSTPLLNDSVPKLAAPQHQRILQKLLQETETQPLDLSLVPGPTPHFIYYQEATNYWTKAVRHIPYYKKNGALMEPPHGRFLYFAEEASAWAIMALLNSALFYLWFATFSDGFHLSHYLVQRFPLHRSLLQQPELLRLAQQLEQELMQHARISTRNTHENAQHTNKGLSIELAEYRPACCRPLLERIDNVLAETYQLDSEELAFVLGYDQKYRMGRG
uniref:site-specific DNA-methyltransferase (adenine-specific) n=1 Tax=Thermosporothrix sp. COM3 TaxID=2490863 RepID=A0A455SM54_9CHLR|nr:hypothetical protein KTC_31990 [Thermosporothrix sp. COM3]